jgi:hypothetical protein
MKKKHLLLLLTLFYFFTSQGQTTYVNQDAGGSGDGSSWANAYTDLTVALENTSSGDIWVAAGTYKPGSGIIDTFSRFEIGNDINLYGGFAGTESNIDDRDIESNVTHLDGDLSGDDSVNDFDNNKTDNVLSVVYVDSLLTNVTIDGFTISGGHGNIFNADLNIHLRAGGGIFSNSSITVMNCTFQQNFSGHGGALITNGIGTSGSLISNCVFEDNYATSSGILYLFNQANTTVEFCTFRDNNTNRGSLYPNSCANILVSDCVFENNINPTGFSAGMWSWQNVGLMVTNTSFTNNSATNAGAFYGDGRNITGTISASDIILSNCNFNGNSALVDDAAGWGGAIYFFNAGFTMMDCTLENNVALNGGGLYINLDDVEAHQASVAVLDNCNFLGNGANLGAPDTGRGGAFRTFSSSFTATGCTFEGNGANSTGGAFYATGANKTYSFEDCIFEENSATWGGAMTNYGADSFVDIIDCEFLENISANGGGAISNGFLTEAYIEGTLFNTNAGGWGGAIFNQNDTTAVTIVDCEFYSNNVNSTGGAIYSTGKITTNISNSIFEGNQADFGAGIAVTEGGLDGGMLNVTNSIFNLNAAMQGAGINISDIDANITSCLFSTNIASDPGTGGGISTNTSDSSSLVVNVTNSTFVLNFGILAAGIAAWEGGDAANAVHNLQNNIFYNPGYWNFAIEDGTPEVVSLGGNFSSDDSMNDLLTHVKDISGEDNDPLFVDEDDEDYHLSPASPCVNAGVNEGAPEFDLDGIARVGDVDMGAYEYDSTISTKEIVIDNNGQLSISPNPAVSNIDVLINNDWKGDLTISIINTKGQVLNNISFTKIQTLAKEQINVSTLPAGNYEILISDGSQVLTSSFVKL